MVFKDTTLPTRERAHSVPLARPFLNGREEELVCEVLRSGRLAGGPMLERFEQAAAQALGVRHAVACASGAGTLKLAGLGAALQPGDEILVSALAGPSALAALRASGARPVLVDVRAGSLSIDPDAAAAAVTPRTRALVVSHTLGYPADMGSLSVLAAQHGLAMVEDAREALGATIGGRPVGTLGHPAAFDFGVDRQVAIGDGGMLVTDDDELVARWRGVCARASTGAVAPQPMGAVAAAIGLAQLEKLPRMLAMRAHVATYYAGLLHELDGVTLPFQGAAQRSWSSYVVELDGAIDRDQVIEGLSAHGIEAAPSLVLAHAPAREREHGWLRGMFPVAERAAAHSVALPFYPHMSPGAQERVTTALHSLL